MTQRKKMVPTRIRLAVQDQIERLHEWAVHLSGSNDSRSAARQMRATLYTLQEMIKLTWFDDEITQAVLWDIRALREILIGRDVYQGQRGDIDAEAFRVSATFVRNEDEQCTVNGGSRIQ